MLDAISAETGKTVAQVALNWLLQRPTVASVIIGARDEAQLPRQPGRPSAGISPPSRSPASTPSATDTIYPYWHQRGTIGTRSPVETVPGSITTFF